MDDLLKRLTDNQRAMLHTLNQRSLRIHEITQGQSPTVTSLVRRGLAEIERAGGLGGRRWIQITNAGRSALRSSVTVRGE